MALLVVVAAVFYSVFSLDGQRLFHTSGYDLTIFDQAVRNYAHLSAPVSIMKGVHNGFGPHFDVLGDHFSPILVVLAPFYRLWPHVSTLLVAQAILLALSSVPVWLVTRRLLGVVPAWLITGAYLLAWELQAMLVADFHELAFAVPLVAVGLERLQAGRVRQATIAILALLLVKEDMGLVVAAFGVVLAIQGRGRLGAALVVTGVVAVFVTTWLLIPAFGGRAGYYWYYDALGRSVPSALAHVLRHPLSTLELALTPPVKQGLLMWLLAPLAFLPLASPYVLLALPLLAERLLSANPNYWTTGHQYNAVLAPILTIAAVDGLARLMRIAPRLRVRHAAGAWGIATSGIAIGLAVAVFPFGSLLTSAGWRLTTADKAADAAVATVPTGVEVAASDHLAPHLSDRANVVLFDTVPRDTPWVVIDVAHLSFPFTSRTQEDQAFAALGPEGYKVTFSRDGFLVLHRASTGIAQ